MSWLLLFALLLYLMLPWLFQKRADRRHRKRIKSWRNNSSPIRRGDSIDLMLRTFSVERETEAASVRVTASCRFMAAEVQTRRAGTQASA